MDVSALKLYHGVVPGEQTKWSTCSPSLKIALESILFVFTSVAFPYFTPSINSAKLVTDLSGSCAIAVNLKSHMINNSKILIHLLNPSGAFPLKQP